MTQSSPASHLAGKVAELEAAFPSHQIWYVPRAVGPFSWHARRWDDPATPALTLTADSPQALAELLQREAGERPSA